MTRGGAAAVVALWFCAAGCMLDTSGQGTAAQPSPNDGDGTATGGATGTATDNGGDEQTSVADGSGDNNPMDSGPGGHPEVIISDGPTFNFGGVDFGASASHTFTVDNQGDASAEGLEVAPLSGDFAIANTDCGGTLAAGAVCTVDVSLSPSRFGPQSQSLTLQFTDAGTPGAATRPIDGMGVGRTTNLLTNPGAEEGPADMVPPQDWMIVSANSWTASGGPVEPYTGSRLFRPGNDDATTFFVLAQRVQVDALTTWGDAEGLTFVARARHRGTFTSLDNSWIQLRFGNVGGKLFTLRQSADHDGDNWEHPALPDTAPVGTHYAQIELVCDISVGNGCDGYFDDAELWAEWIPR